VGRLAPLLGAVLTVAATPATASAAPFETRLASRADGVSGAAWPGNTRPLDISGDGRYVLFHNGIGLFVRDVQTGRTERIDRASGESGAVSGGVEGHAQISSDGRYVAFGARGVAGFPGCFCVQVYRRDRVTHETLLVSRAPGAAGAPAGVNAYAGGISDDGRFVVFNSPGENLGEDQNYPPGPHGLITDAFVRDVEANTNELVSRGTGATATPGDDHANGTSISGDGRFVVFTSAARNISGEDSDGPFYDVFVRDRNTDTTTLVSRRTGAAGEPANDWSDSARISRDGSTVVFASSASNLSTEDSDVAPAPYSAYDIFARDLGAKTTTLVSRATGHGGAGGDAPSVFPSVSGDGRFVAFESAASNLTGEDPHVGYSYTPVSVFVRDRATGRTWVADRASGMSGAVADGSGDALISDDARMLAFGSLGRLTAEDSGNRYQTYRRDISAGPPPDGDLDGVQDALDNCPAVADTLQGDLDRDGVGDVCDAPAAGGGPVGSFPGGGGVEVTTPSIHGSTRSARVRRGRFRLSFRTQPGLRGRVRVARGRKRLAGSAFVAGASGKVRLALRLNRRGRALLRRRSVLRTTVIVVVRDARGATVTVRLPLKLRR
jgi:Tol biopolymer transport system component